MEILAAVFFVTLSYCRFYSLLISVIGLDCKILGTIAFVSCLVLYKIDDHPFTVRAVLNSMAKVFSFFFSFSVCTPIGGCRSLAAGAFGKPCINLSNCFPTQAASLQHP